MPLILIVEDDINNVEILEDLLTDEGFDLQIASNRDDAVRMAAECQPDLILLDMQLPDSEESGMVNHEAGLEAARTMRESEVNRETPIVALTAHNMLHQQERILAAGCNDMQAKPYDFDELLARIRRFLA